MNYIKHPLAIILAPKVEGDNISFSLITDREVVYTYKIPNCDKELFRELFKVVICTWALGLTTIYRKVRIAFPVTSVEYDFVQRIKMPFFSGMSISTGYYLMAPPCIGELEFTQLQEEASFSSFLFSPSDFNKVSVGYSGGKESLLSYLLLKEAGYETHKLFINEGMAPDKDYFSGEQTIYYDNDIWKEVFDVVGKDHWYPSTSLIRLLLNAVYSASNGIGYVVSGNEYSCTGLYFSGVSNSLSFGTAYGQSLFAMKEVERYFKLRGVSLSVFSSVQNMDILTEEVLLYKYFHKEADTQVSCFNHYEKDGKLNVCGVCPKCELMNVLMVILQKNSKYFKLPVTWVTPFLRNYDIIAVPKNVKTLISEEEIGLYNSLLNSTFPKIHPVQLRFDSLHPAGELPKRLYDVVTNKVAPFKRIV